MVTVLSTTPSAKVKKQVVCNNCGSLLEYVPAEVKKYSRMDYSGGPDGRHWID